MADLFDPYFRQQVTEAEAQAWLENLEAADHNIMVDLGFFGILGGADVSQHSTGDMTVDVDGPGVGYDQLGQRVYWPTTERIDCSEDHNASSTEVVGVGNSRWISLVGRFLRVASDPRTDGNGLPVNYSQAEGFEILVFAGSEALSPTKPSLPTDGFLICDILLVYGQTQILDADINTDRRQEVLVTPALAGTYADHVAGIGDRHTAAMIDSSALNAWADTSTNPSGTVQAQLAGIVNALRATTEPAGAKKIGAKTVSGSPYSLATTTVSQQLGELLTQLNAAYAAFGAASGISASARGTWLDLEANGSTTVQGALAKIITDLTNATVNHTAADRLSATATTHLTGSTIQSMLTAAESNVPWKDAASVITGAWSFSDITVTGATPKVKCPSTAASRWFLGSFFSSPVGDWVDGGTSIKNAATGGGVCYIPIDHVPNGVTITQIDVAFEGAAGHGSLPGTMPKIRLVSVTGTTGAFTNESTQGVDGSGSTGAYESVHLLTKSGLSIVVDKAAKRYMIQVASEVTPNDVANALIHSARVTFNSTFFDFAAG
jgi:hypothetical protein